MTQDYWAHTHQRAMNARTNMREAFLELEKMPQDRGRFMVWLKLAKHELDLAIGEATATE